MTDREIVIELAKLIQNAAFTSGVSEDEAAQGYSTRLLLPDGLTNEILRRTP